ncbi:MAG: putative membrane protein YfcA [Woeseiaceae bacterium]|jgi:uncharacterized membrane protein YfcA
MDTSLIALIAFVVAGFVKGVLGFGFPIVALIVLTLAFGLFDALAIIVVPTLATNIWQALSGDYLGEIMRRMWLYFLVALIAIFTTSFFIADINVNWLTGMLGGVLFLFSLSRLLNFHFVVPRDREPILSLVLGAINGALTGFTGSFMVPSVLYMQALGFNRDMLVQAMGTFFALSTIMLAVSLSSNDLISGDQLKVSVIALVPAFAGVFAGRWVRKQVNEEHFQKLFLAMVLVLGAYIMMRAALAL